MDLGIVLQTDPPATRTVALARRAEELGFSHAWTFDSHVLWQEPYVIHSRILAETTTLRVGPMVTNPVTRDPTVTASTFATLNEMYGNRTVCGIGRGDSAVRVTGGRPTTLKALREAVRIVQGLGGSREVDVDGVPVSLSWSHGSEVPVWVAAYGPLALRLAGEVADGFILQLADLDLAEWMITTVRRAAQDVGRDPAGITMCVAAPMYVTDGSEEGLAHAREQCRWFGGMVGNHVADIVARYGSGAQSGVPAALTDYVAGREGYDYREHGRAGNSHAAFVPDEIVDRFCVLGTAEQHLEKLEGLRALGVDQFAGYLQHDDQDATLEAYGEHVVPAVSRW